MLHILSPKSYGFWKEEEGGRRRRREFLCSTICHHWTDFVQILYWKFLLIWPFVSKYLHDNIQLITE
jgi:hypothetical protein